MSEPCIICCPVDDVPADIAEFVAEVRAEFPADTLKDVGRLPIGLGVCWNCRGARVVVPKEVRV